MLKATFFLEARNPRPRRELFLSFSLPLPFQPLYKRTQLSSPFLRAPCAVCKSTSSHTHVESIPSWVWSVKTTDYTFPRTMWRCSWKSPIRTVGPCTTKHVSTKISMRRIIQFAETFRWSREITWSWCSSMKTPGAFIRWWTYWPEAARSNLSRQSTASIAWSSAPVRDCTVYHSSTTLTDWLNFYSFK